MHYYAKNIGDYARDTGHLSMTEHGAYNLLMDVCYATERPLPLDRVRVYALVRAIERRDRAAVDKCMEDFFDLREDGYHQKRIDAEIAEYQDKSTKSKRAAKVRWKHANASANAPPSASANANASALYNSADASADASKNDADASPNAYADAMPTKNQEPIPVETDVGNPTSGAVDNSGNGQGKGLAIDRERQRQNSAGSPWWVSDNATKAKAVELGVEARPGESMAEFMARIHRAIAERKR